MDEVSSPLTPAVLRDLWDFDEPALSADRFAALAADPSVPALHRAELATQHARALGLQGEYDRAHAVLDEIADPLGVVGVRLLLERGRLVTSAGDPGAAVPFYRAAVDAAFATSADLLAVDALHMLAMADAGREQEWTGVALEVVDRSSDPDVRRWSIALHNNRGWHLHDTGELDEALREFVAAHGACEELGSVEQEQIARWAIARCLRSLGRGPEALQLQRRLLVERPDDPYVREELAALEGRDAGG